MSGNTFVKDDYFKVDVEAHLIGDRTHIDYYPGVKQWWRAAEGLRQPLYGPEGGPCWPRAGEERVTSPDDIIALMDKYGVDMACLIPEVMMDSTGNATRWVTNGYAASVCEAFPDRFIFTPNVGPVIKRGIKNALWEMEYLVRERNARMIKLYPPEDTYINDRRMWPFYDKVVELDIPLAVHVGWSWVPPGLSKYCLPIQLDEVATLFPELKVIAFHMGWPYPHDLNLVAATHPNIYIGINLLARWGLTAPLRFAELIGEAIRFATSDRVVWGTDFTGLEVAIRSNVLGLRDFQIPEDLQQGYGYSPLTELDKRKVFGENMARLLGIEPRRRVGR